MKDLLRDPKKRTMLLAAGAGGVLLLFLLLHKKTSSSAEPAAGETGVTASAGGINPATGIPYAQELAAAQSGGGGGGIAGGSAGNEAALSELGAGQQQLAQALVTSNQETQSEIAKSIQAENEGLQALAQSNQTQFNSLGTSLSQLISTGLSATPTATSASPGPAPATTTPGRSPSQPPGVQRNTQSNNPREGLNYSSGTYKGKSAHIYQQAVPGGVGPKKNIIIL